MIAVKKILVLYFTLISLVSFSQNKIIKKEEKKSHHKIFCNALALNLRTKYFSALSNGQLLNLSNHKIYSLDYYPVDLYHFRFNISAEYNHSNFNVPVVVNYQNQTVVNHDVKVRNYLLGAGVYYDFNHEIIFKKSKKKIKIHFQLGLSFMAYLSSTTTYYFQNQLKWQYKTGYLNKSPKYLFRDEIRLILLEKINYSVGLSVANLIPIAYGDMLEGPADFPIGYSSFGINFNYKLK